MSLQLESAQERLKYPEVLGNEILLAAATAQCQPGKPNQTLANECKARGQVLYNCSCQRRGNACGAPGYGYLGQVAGNTGWGTCIKYNTRPQAPTPGKQTNNTKKCAAHCYTIWGTPPWFQPFPDCKSCSETGAGVGTIGVGPGGPVSGGTGPKATTGTPASKKCGGCNFGDIGCETGKHFCEFQGWLTESAGGIGMPLMIGGGLIIALLLLKR